MARAISWALHRLQGFGRMSDGEGDGTYPISNNEIAAEDNTILTTEDGDQLATEQ